MAENGNLNARLTRLAETLDRFRLPTTTSGDAPADTHLDKIADERLRHLSALLRDRLDDPQIDIDDALLLRLVLDDVSAAVGHLRALVSEIEERLSNGTRVLKEGRRAVVLERARTESTDPVDDR